jgi:hypothetical protein
MPAAACLDLDHHDSSITYNLKVDRVPDACRKITAQRVGATVS